MLADIPSFGSLGNLFQAFCPQGPPLTFTREPTFVIPGTDKFDDVTKKLLFLEMASKKEKL